jgi:hypothetical protein
MKFLDLVIPFALLSVFSYSPGDPKYRSPAGLTDTDTLIIGDINHDKIIDTAFVTGPKWLNDDEGWGDPRVTPYEIDITFSCGLPPIHDDNAVRSYVEDIGDIDRDGISEVIIVPSWFIGCWGRMKFYTYKEGQWRNFGSAECHICTDEIYSGRITRLSKNKISVIEDAWDDEAADRIKKPKIIKLSNWKNSK